MNLAAELPQPDRLKALAEQAVARKRTELQVGLTGTPTPDAGVTQHVLAPLAARPGANAQHATAQTLIVCCLRT